jgi:low temperature requirement protein LtrA
MAATAKSSRTMLRSHASAERATNIELFFDLVYVFAVTQLSHHLLAEPTWRGAGQTVLLFGLVWLAWAYTTWVTNWLDPQRLPVRSMLIALMFMSLVMSAALPLAFGSRGLAVGCAYAAMQIGRTVFTVFALRGNRLQRNFERILVWCVVSGTLAVIGGIVHGRQRELLWLLAVAVDVLGGMVGFYTPGLGRSRTTDWTIEGNHLAERCQAFLLIALGESVVVIGATVSGLRVLGSAEVIAFVATFVGAAALWWIYFDRSADDAARVIAASKDPGRLGRSAYHLLHPIMIAGIIVTAAADQKVLTHPLATPDTATAAMILGGSGLFLAGHAAFKAAVWKVVPRTRLVAIVVLALLGFLAPHVSAIVLGVCAGAVLIALAASDRRVGAPAASPSAQTTEA